MPGTHRHQAFATLVTSDDYGIGALVLGHSLKQHGTSRQLVLLYTSNVTNHLLNRLRRTWDITISVETLRSGDRANLALLGRPELDISYTKIHLWKELRNFDKVVYLDADTFVLKNVDGLFEFPSGGKAIAAAPDMGWPDCFNSGMFVFRPNEDTFSKLLLFSQTHASFDGGDQGLLNEFFPEWERVSFIYNMTHGASYQYRPAYKRYKGQVAIVHFAGGEKPWNYERFFDGGVRQKHGESEESLCHVQLWWDLHDKYISGWNKSKGAFSKYDTPWTTASLTSQVTVAMTINPQDSRPPWEQAAIPVVIDQNSPAPEITPFGSYKIIWNEDELKGSKHTPIITDPDDENLHIHDDE